MVGAVPKLARLLNSNTIDRQVNKDLVHETVCRVRGRGDWYRERLYAFLPSHDEMVRADEVVREYNLLIVDVRVPSTGARFKAVVAMFTCKIWNGAKRMVDMHDKKSCCTVSIHKRTWCLLSVRTQCAKGVAPQCIISTRSRRLAS